MAPWAVRAGRVPHDGNVPQGRDRPRACAGRKRDSVEATLAPAVGERRGSPRASFRSSIATVSTGGQMAQSTDPPPWPGVPTVALRPTRPETPNNARPTPSSSELQRGLARIITSVSLPVTFCHGALCVQRPRPQRSQPPPSSLQSPVSSLRTDHERRSCNALRGLRALSAWTNDVTKEHNDRTDPTRRPDGGDTRAPGACACSVSPLHRSAPTLYYSTGYPPWLGGVRVRLGAARRQTAAWAAPTSGGCKRRWAEDGP